MTKQDALKSLGIDETKIDYALPESFNNEMRTFIECPPAHFVWSYEGKTVFGFPRPLTVDGNNALQAYNEKNGTAYNTKLNVLTL